MGCASSKRSISTVDVYHPSQSSFAVFDINAIDEPWVKAMEQSPQEKPTHVPAVILEKLNALEDAPHSWDEVSKALEDIKPTINNNNNDDKKVKLQVQAPKSSPTPAKQVTKDQLRKNSSFHTLEELDAKLSSKPVASELNSKPAASELSKTESMGKETVPKVSAQPVGTKLKENIFILKDRQEREKEGRMANYDKLMMSKRDPLSQYPEICPPGGSNTVVIYTTSLRGVRRTFDECNKVKGIFELQRAVFDERDVSLHGEFLNELRKLLGDEETSVSVPKVFVKGRYIGGAEEVSELNETGRLGKILSMAGMERGVGRLACGGCGGARFLPCFECGGSCKVVAENGDRERCGKCNENGLIHCPTCL